MRLIDADKLKEYINEKNWIGFVICKIIDLQPTVTIDTPKKEVSET